MLQLTKRLFEHVWNQWCNDTQQMAAGLPQALSAQAPGQPLLLSLERWIILLKVSGAASTSKVQCLEANCTLRSLESSSSSCFALLWQAYVLVTVYSCWPAATELQYMSTAKLSKIFIFAA